MRWPTALLGLILACGVLWSQRAALAYFLSPREPISLGSEASYSFSRLASNRYAEIHGAPSANAAWSRKGDRVYVVLGFQNTPLLVRREAFPTEEWIPRRPPPRPDPRPFSARGRLLAREDAPEYETAFQMLASDVVPKDGRLWILLDGERPGGDARTLIASGLLTAFALLSLALLVRDVASRILRPTSAASSR